MLFMLAMLGIVIGGATCQLLGGLYTKAAFADAPPRNGQLGLHDIVITIGLWLFGSSIGAMIAKPIVGDDPSSLGMLITLLLSQGGALVMVGYVLVRASQAVEGGAAAFGFNLRHFNDSLDRTIAVALFIIPATFVTLAGMAIVTTWLGYPPPRLAHTMLEAIRDADSPAVALGLAMVPILLAPVIEEPMFRGMMQTVLRHAAGFERWPTIIITSVLFSLVHLAAVPWQSMPGLFVLSLGLGYAYERTGKLWAPMAIHALFNAVNVTLVLSGAISE